MVTTPCPTTLVSLLAFVNPCFFTLQFTISGWGVDGLDCAPELPCSTSKLQQRQGRGRGPSKLNRLREFPIYLPLVQPSSSLGTCSRWLQKHVASGLCTGYIRCGEKYICVYISIYAVCTYICVCICICICMCMCMCMCICICICIF